MDAMKIVWIILAVLSFIGGQVYLFHCLRKLDTFLKHRPSYESSLTYDDAYRYPEDFVRE